MKKDIMCLDCGCQFSISVRQIKSYKKRGLHIPSHCPMCRDIRWKEDRIKTRQAKKFERNKNYE